MIIRWGVPVPEQADLPALPTGIVLHWTGGTHRASDVDLEHYHYVVESDGTVRRGNWPVSANMRKLGDDDNYAAHTGGYNSFHVGIAVAGMRGYKGPNQVGEYPILRGQVVRACEIAAYFCRLAGLDASRPRSVCTHREVWTLFGIKGKQNHLKPDIEFLPFRPDLKPDQVGPELRILVGLCASPVLADALDVGLVKWPSPNVAVPKPAPPAPRDLPNPNPVTVMAETKPRGRTIFGREPAAIIAAAAAVLQSVGILWAHEWRAAEVDPELWLMPVVTAVGGLATRENVMPVDTVKEAGLTPAEVKSRAANPHIRRAE